MQAQAQKLIYYPKKQLLSCRLCTDIFKKPTTLTCGHTFCYFCLYKFMKQNYNSKDKYSNIQKLFNQESKIQKCQQEFIPLPLCPTCSSLILKPIKFYKQNLTLTNLILHSKLTPELKFQNQNYDQEIQNFDHKILIKIDHPKIEPLPYCYSEVRFSTCFLDDMLEQSHAAYVVIQWPNFKRNIGLAGKILRTEMQYDSSSNRGKQNSYRGYFYGLFFVQIKKRKSLQINLRSRYYTQTAFYNDNQQFSILDICKCQPFHSLNIQSLASFDYFLSFYDTLNNPHYLNQIYQIIDRKPFFQRNNPQIMIYCCIRILKFNKEERKEIIELFDDERRIHKINDYLQKNNNFPIQDYMYISIPGKYNSAFVFGVIFLLILLHYFQSN